MLTAWQAGQLCWRCFSNGNKNKIDAKVLKDNKINFVKKIPERFFKVFGIIKCLLLSQVIGSFGFYLNGLNVANVTPTFFFSKIALQKYKYHPSKTQKITYGGRIMSKVLVCTLLLNKYLKCVVNEDILREQLLLMGEPKGGDHFLSSNSSNTNISLLAQLKWQLLRANIWLFGFLASWRFSLCVNFLGNILLMS